MPRQAMRKRSANLIASGQGKMVIRDTVHDCAEEIARSLVVWRI